DYDVPTELGAEANRCRTAPYPTDTAGWHIGNHPQQMVGPHVSARMRYARALGDTNGDGIRDMALGSLEIKERFSNPAPGPDSPLTPGGSTVGAVFVLYTRPAEVVGDYLLEQIALDPSNLNRLNGVYLKGTAAAPIGRAFDTAGNFNNDFDFNGEPVDDVVVGSPLSNNGDGEAIVLFGSASNTLLSPAGGWTLDQAVAAGVAVRFRGSSGERAGYNVAGAGDVDNDGFGDVLIAAPGTGSTAGAVYLIYGSERIVAGNTYNLSDVGTASLPGVKFLGRNVGDFLGGGEVSDTLNPSGGATTVISRGLAALGDIDGDGRADYAISAMRARPNNRTNAGEVYVIYGRGD
ncbi:MAG: integrin alpha, partial [Dongiaceae bacterium]